MAIILFVKCDEFLKDFVVIDVEMQLVNGFGRTKDLIENFEETCATDLIVDLDLVEFKFLGFHEREKVLSVIVELVELHLNVLFCL